MTDTAILEKVRKSIKNSDPNASAYLFGSRARGDHKKDSDWDILILVDEEKVTNEVDDRFRENLYKIELETGQIISTFVYSKSHWNGKMRYSPLYEDLKLEGIAL